MCALLRIQEKERKLDVKLEEGKNKGEEERKREERREEASASLEVDFFKYDLSIFLVYFLL